MYYYLDHHDNCNFLNHKVSIHLNGLLRTIRKSDIVTSNDYIIIQALLEIVDEIMNYGPFSIIVKYNGRSEYITVLYDQLCVMMIDRKGDSIGISYIREDDIEWAEKLCILANACTELFT